MLGVNLETAALEQFGGICVHFNGESKQSLRFWTLGKETATTKGGVVRKTVQLIRLCGTRQALPTKEDCARIFLIVFNLL